MYRDFDRIPCPPTLPSFDEQVTAERVLGAAHLYYIYQHERVGLFRAVMKLQEMFKTGRLKLSTGPGAVALYQFDRQRVLRYTQRERMQAYKRVFGYTETALPSGARANNKFHQYFVNFNTLVSQYFRDKRVSDVIQSGSGGAMLGSVAVVRRAGLDLRNNLKGATYGNVNILRLEVMQLLDQTFDILGSEDIRNLYGAQDAWDVLNEVLRRELGEESLVSQRSRMAETGMEILNWIARGDILTNNRQGFDARLAFIGDYVEEWLTSAESVGVKPAPQADTTNVVPLNRPKRYSVI